MSSTAEEIKNIRKKIGLSARAFAQAIGSNVCSIYNFENGRSEPKNPKIMERARALYSLFMELRNDADYLKKTRDKFNSEHEKNEKLVTVALNLLSLSDDGCKLLSHETLKLAFSGLVEDNN